MDRSQRSAVAQSRQSVDKPALASNASCRIAHDARAPRPLLSERHGNDRRTCREARQAHSALGDDPDRAEPGRQPGDPRSAVEGVRRAEPGRGHHPGPAQGRGRARRPRCAGRRSCRRQGPCDAGKGRSLPASSRAWPTSSSNCVSIAPQDAATRRVPFSRCARSTGGDEAALFAADLFRMYSRYAEAPVEGRDHLISENDLGGYKEIVASISGKGVFARLKYGSGVHRVQRCPRHGSQRARPHLGRHRCRVAGG